MTAWMDGTHPVEILSRDTPRGIAVDYKSSKLFWLDSSEKKVQSSGLDGSDVKTWAKESGLYGIVVDNTEIYFSNYSMDQPSALIRCNKTGGGVKVLFQESKKMKHLAVVPSRPPVTSRENHCDGRSCPGDGICTLTPFWYTCLDP